MKRNILSDIPENHRQVSFSEIFIVFFNFSLNCNNANPVVKTTSLIWPLGVLNTKKHKSNNKIGAGVE